MTIAYYIVISLVNSSILIYEIRRLNKNINANRSIRYNIALVVLWSIALFFSLLGIFIKSLDQFLIQLSV